MTERKAPYWRFFERKARYIATCKICFQDYSFRSTTTNLNFHLKRKHGVNARAIENDSEAEKVMSSAKKRRGKAMTYYDIVGPNKTEAQCKLCEKTFSIEAFTEIQEHLVDYHGEMPTDYTCPKKPKVVFRRQYWRFFTKKEPFVATCKLCFNDYSYRTTISNLAHHLRNKHGVDMTGPASDSDSEGEIGNSFNEKKGAATWSFFDVLDSDKFEARCKICEKNIEYDSVEDLKKHVEDHGQHPQDSDDEEQVSKSRHFSELWKYFKKLDRSSNFALCLICKNVYNAQTISNLKKHLVTKHRDAEVPEEDEKKYIVASNGQLYEMESDKGDDNEDTEDKDPIEMDTVYLEDLEDFNTSRPSTPTPSPPKKKAKPIFSKPQSPAKPRNEQILNNSINNENNRNNDTTPRRNSYNTSLDYFGQYVVSLLKELPKSVSSQLQNEIIKQILTSKVALESEVSNCKVSINHNTDNQTNITEPVMYIQTKSNT